MEPDVLSEEEISLILGKDLVVKKSPAEELNFRDWMLMKKGISALSVKPDFDTWSDRN